MGTKARVLVVEDEATVRELLSEALTDEGYDCQSASGVDAALVKLSQGPVDLVICDIKMPGRNGLELLQEVRANFPDTAAIMATAVADLDTAIESLKKGAQDYLVKPFNLTELALSVDRALNMRRLEQENKEYQVNLEQRVEEQTHTIRDTFLGGIRSLAEALEAKDVYTRGHSQRVMELSLIIVEKLQMDETRTEKIGLAAELHDIGKIGVRDAVLHKPGSLSPEEYQHVLSHVVIGEKILRPMLREEDTLAMVKHHHERCDGCGFPDRLKREDIPFGARILAVTDAYDAMTSERPYRTALPHEEACTRLQQATGSQFDPEVVVAFLGCVGDNGRSHPGQSSDQRPVASGQQM